MIRSKLYNHNSYIQNLTVVIVIEGTAKLLIKYHTVVPLKAPSAIKEKLSTFYLSFSQNFLSIKILSGNNVPAIHPYPYPTMPTPPDPCPRVSCAFLVN